MAQELHTQSQRLPQPEIHSSDPAIPKRVRACTSSSQPPSRDLHNQDLSNNPHFNHQFITTNKEKHEKNDLSGHRPTVQKTISTKTRASEQCHISDHLGSIKSKGSSSSYYIDLIHIVSFIISRVTFEKKEGRKKFNSMSLFGW